MKNLLQRYAELLTRYCLELQPGDRFFVRSTTAAEPLVQAVYRAALQAGAHPEVELSFPEQHRLLIEHGTDEQLRYVPTLYQKAMATFDAYLFIRAPYNLREDQDLDSSRTQIRQDSLQPVVQQYFQRTATRELKRTLCQYPTQAAAQTAGMSLSQYEHFVYDACRLYDEDPVASWLAVRQGQQAIVDLLNQGSQIQYVGPHIDLTFSTGGRTWINSDGQTNMPSGEVYTSPVEDAVNGWVHFTYPSVYQGHEVEDVQLWLKDGQVERWEARRGQDFLDHIFSLPGTRRLGEAAIGTNYRIKRLSNNILFDEKIGGTVHLAIGQSYQQAGGKNVSPIHWDMITDMTDGGEVRVDGEVIYRSGRFLNELDLVPEKTVGQPI